TSIKNRLLVDDTTEATTTTDGSLQTDGGLSVVKDAIIGGSLDAIGGLFINGVPVSDYYTLNYGGNIGSAGNTNKLQNNGLVSSGSINVFDQRTEAVAIVGGFISISWHKANSGSHNFGIYVNGVLGQAVVFVNESGYLATSLQISEGDLISVAHQGSTTAAGQTFSQIMITQTQQAFSASFARSIPNPQELITGPSLDDRLADLESRLDALTN
ncbi:MAG: hypothetical protein ACPH3C_06240, partial [Glaciecola sp.]